jgi:hypothetical protein
LLTSSDKRIRGFPFTTFRPTKEELERCYQNLTQIEPTIFTETEKAKESPLKSVKTLKPKPLTELQKSAMTFIRESKLNEIKSINISEILNDTFAESDGSSLLHLAASTSSPEMVEYLLELGADPTIQSSNSTPYEVARSNLIRNTFRRFMGKHPDNWNYAISKIPGPLTDEMQQAKKERLKSKKTKEREQKLANSMILMEEAKSQEKVISNVNSKLSKISISKRDLEVSSMSPEARQRLDREKRSDKYNPELWLLSRE